MSPVIAAIEKLADRIDRLEKAVKAPARDAWRPREVAKKTGISYNEVLELIRRGELGSIPVGRLHIVPDAELKRFLAAGTRAA